MPTEESGKAHVQPPAIERVGNSLKKCNLDYPRNGSWTGVSARDTVPDGDISVRFSDALARRDDDAGLILLGEATPPESLKNVQSHP